ncbi:MAG: hypothetical protein QJR12_07720 [Mycobacterium sp.]|uniref:hypothetical protein n=1 Tax=Mycobacterium sp. TaxID=1785 RepID=UPI0026196AA7|nr:hypothetical protein [Mycobacterium sp.]MDI3314159.1 hypothetical protein [Mycobacterium sp.]
MRSASAGEPPFTSHANGRRGEQRRGWPGYLFGGHVRTSTVMLILAFLAVWWVYDAYRPETSPKSPAPPAVPPGYVPDPNYTWVPRSRLQQPPATVTVTETASATPVTTPPTTAATSPPLFPPQVVPPPSGPTAPVTTSPAPGATPFVPAPAGS